MGSSEIDRRMVDLVLREGVEFRRNRAAERIYGRRWLGLSKREKVRVWLGIWDWWKIGFWVVVVVMVVSFWVWVLMRMIGWL